MADYDWPETEDNTGRCEVCGFVRPLKSGLCRGCGRDGHAEDERDARRDDKVSPA